MTTLAAPINETQRAIALSGDVTAARPGRLYCIEDEVVVLETFGEILSSVGETRPIGVDRSTWIVQRGLYGSVPVAHGVGAVVYGVKQSIVKGASLSDPSPIPTAGSGAHPDLATHDALGLATDAELATHVSASDPHVAYALDADLANHEADTTAIHGIANTANLTLTNDSRLSDSRTPLAHTHQAFPVGALYLSVNNTNPATSLGYGTWSQVAQGLLLIGQTGAQSGAQQVGNATHAHTFTQPSDHAALTHAGAAVANHVVTQPGAHSAHVFTQPAGHSNHVVTQPAAHADNIAHTHGLNVQGGTTAAVTGTHLMTSTATGGSARAITAGDAGLSQGTGASLTHSATAVDAHSAHSGGAVDAHSAHSGAAVDAHAVTQPSNHAIGSHAGGAVATGTTDPPAFVAFVWQRTA